MKEQTKLFSWVVAGAAFYLGPVEAFYPYSSGELFIKAEPRVDYDSNIYANASEEDDWVARLPVGLQLVQDAGYIRAVADVGIEAGFFKENEDENYEDPFARAQLTYDREGHPFWGNAVVGWWRETRADPDIGTRPESLRERPEVERREARFRSRYRFHQRLGLIGAVNYTDWDYSQGYLSDRERYGFEVGAEYSYSPRLDIGLNYSYDKSELETEGALDLSSDDHGVFLSLRGELTPRITQTLDIGVKTRMFERDELEETTEPYAALSFLWQIDPPTQFRITGISDFSFSAENASISEQRVEVSLRREIDPKIAVTFSGYLAHQEFDYVSLDSRTDDVAGGGVELSYLFTDLVSGRLRANYTTRSSDMAFADYERLLASATVLFRF